MRALLAWLLAVVTSLAAAQGVLPVPELTARVIDQTGTLDAIQRKGLDDKLAALWDPLESTCRHASLSIL